MSSVVDRVLEAGECLMGGMRAQTGASVCTERGQTAGHDDRYDGDGDAECQGRGARYVVVVVVK